MAQYWGQAEGEGTGDTKRLKRGWGTDFTEGSIFLAHPAKPRFSPRCERQAEVPRANWNWEQPWVSAWVGLPGGGCFPPSPRTRLQDVRFSSLLYRLYFAG